MIVQPSQSDRLRQDAGWEAEAIDAIGDAAHAIHQGDRPIAIACLERAIGILRRGGHL